MVWNSSPGESFSHERPWYGYWKSFRAMDLNAQGFWTSTYVWPMGYELKMTVLVIVSN
jgi:hypothetical protein